MLKKIIGGLAAFLALIIVLGFVLPDRVTLSRDITIDAPQDEVFALISDFEEWDSWSPWANIDPDAKYELSGSGVGQSMSWKSDHPDVGDGAQTISALDAPSMVATDLDFGDMGVAKARFDLEPVGDSRTKVTWSFETNMREGVPVFMKPMSTYFKFFMEGMLGPQYETGLQNLKKVAEATNV